jgi:hypothetical protein
MGYAVTVKMVKFDIEIDFATGGDIQRQDFRLDFEGDDIHDQGQISMRGPSTLPLHPGKTSEASFGP